MIRHLLDTDICIALIRGRSEPVLDRLKRCPPGSLGISSISLAELWFGVSRSGESEANHASLVQFCAPLQVMPFDTAASATYGRIRAALEGRGTPVGPLDTLIAAHALSLPAVLVTNNEREFRRIPGLKLENWSRR
ncbi:MAG: type II toxin-antitoxin system VapC family toxin [Candidatus Coatesbacteria bacterium]